MTTPLNLVKSSDDDDMVKCRICGLEAHALAAHLHDKHSMSAIEYMEKYPGAQWLSAYGKRIAEEERLRQPRAKTKALVSDLLADLNIEFAGAQEYEIYKHPGKRTPKRDPDYALPVKETLMFLSVIAKAERNNVYILGPTGSGKTTFVENLAALVNADLWSLNGDAYQQRHNAVGGWRVKAGTTWFEYGVVPLWLKYGGWLLINEYDTLNPDLVNVLKPVMESPRHIFLTEHGDEEIVGHPDCRLIVTANTNGRGDDTGLYVNTEVQSAADLRRFHAFIPLDYIEADVEVRMLAKRFPDIPQKSLEKMVKIANDVRDGFKKRKLARPLSTAELITWCDHYLMFDSAHMSARISFLDGFERSLATAVEELITTAFGHPDREVLLSKEIASRASSKTPDQEDEGK